MKISTKLFFWFLIVTFVPVFIVGIIVVIFAQNQFSERIANDLATIAEIQEQRLNNVIELYLDTHNIVSADQRLAEYTRIVISENEDPASNLETLNDILLELHRSVGISRAMSITNEHGTIIASTSPANIGKKRADIEEGAGRIQSISSSLQADNTGSLTVRTIGPIKYNGELVGILEIITIAEPIISIATNFTGLGETGETLMAQRTESGDALFITPTRFDPEAAMKRTVSRLAFDVPITAALQRQERILITGAIDYRGEPVIAATRYYEPLDWGIVIKIDQAEAFQTVREIEYFFWYAIVASTLISLFFSFEVSREMGKQLRKLTVAVEAFERGDYTVRAEGVKRKDEIGLLAKAFNKMADQVQGAHQKLEAKVKERTKALKKNLQLVEHLRAIDDAMLSSIGEAVIAADSKGRISFTNAAFESLFGLKHEEVSGRNIQTILKPHTSDGQPDPVFFDKTYGRLKNPWSGVLYLKDNSDELFPAHVSVAPVLLDKKIIGRVMIMRDISQEKEIEQAKTEFVSIASHQLRTPLSAINWYVELLNDRTSGELNKTQKEYAKAILSSSKRMIGLINALLNVSRIETGKILVDPEPQKVEHIIEEAFAELKPQITKKKLYADFDIQKNLPKVSVDKRLMHIVIQNLLTNAIKYTPENGSIHAKIEKAKAGKEMYGMNIKEDGLLISITDTGFGIPRNQQDKIFQKLFRADNVIEKAIEGTGLGLFVTKSIIEHAEGQIWFTSKEGRGTTFYFTLPLKGMPEKAGVKTLIA